MDNQATVRTEPVSYVYFAYSRGFVKIGFTTGEPRKRMSDLQCGNPEPVRLIAHAPGTALDEKRLHLHFAKLRHHGEWFVPGEELRCFLSSIIRTKSIRKALNETERASISSPRLDIGYVSETYAAEPKLSKWSEVLRVWLSAGSNVSESDVIVPTATWPGSGVGYWLQLRRPPFLRDPRAAEAAFLCQLIELMGNEDATVAYWLFAWMRHLDLHGAWIALLGELIDARLPEGAAASLNYPIRRPFSDNLGADPESAAEFVLAVARKRQAMLAMNNIYVVDSSAPYIEPLKDQERRRYSFLDQWSQTQRRIP